MLIDKINLGEIIFGNLKISYEKNNRKYIKELKEVIFSKKYNDKLFPIIDKDLYSILLRKLDKNKNQHYLLKNIKILELKIISRTGYICKKHYENNTKRKY